MFSLEKRINSWRTYNQVKKCFILSKILSDKYLPFCNGPLTLIAVLSCLLFVRDRASLPPSLPMMRTSALATDTALRGPSQPFYWWSGAQELSSPQGNSPFLLSNITWKGHYWVTCRESKRVALSFLISVSLSSALPKLEAFWKTDACLQHDPPGLCRCLGYLKWHLCFLLSSFCGYQPLHWSFPKGVACPVPCPPLSTTP